MSFTDKSIVCSDCGATFVFSAEEQEFFQSKGYTNEPKRCPTCRQARKQERFGNSGGVGGGRRPTSFGPGTPTGGRSRWIWDSCRKRLLGWLDGMTSLP